MPQQPKPMIGEDMSYSRAEPKKSNIERRTFTLPVEVRSDGGTAVIVGHAAVFNTYTHLGWFQERVMPGAFADTIRVDDIRALFNHDANFVLGRNRAGTLELEEDERGLAVVITPPDSQLVRDLVLIPIQRGDITQMSFGFETLEDAWQYEPDRRDLIRVKLYDVSPVTFPAYENTDVAIRSHRLWRSKNPTAITTDRALDIRKKRLALMARR